MNSIIKTMFIFFLVLIFGSAVSVGYFANEFYFKRPASGTAPTHFTIEEGSGVKKISGALKSGGIIKNRFVFETYVWLIGAERIFQVGEYDLRPGDNIFNIVKTLTTVFVKTRRLTLIEGWNLRDIAAYLKEQKIIKNERELYALTGRPLADYRKTAVDFRGWDYRFLSDRPPYAGLEGYIYPDTYFILEKDGVAGLVQKALKNFGDKLAPDLEGEIERQKKTVFDVVTMASIVEREVRGYEDRRFVADIFWRRIKMGMPLGADSAINYITGSGRDRSTYDDLKIDSPWNVYKYAGLPLGPISNPSIEAIRATIYPAPNNYLYFLTDKDGGVHYAKTAAEHTRNRAKYLK